MHPKIKSAEAVQVRWTRTQRKTQQTESDDNITKKKENDIQLCHQVSIEFSAEESIFNSRWYIMISHKRTLSQLLLQVSPFCLFIVCLQRSISFILPFSTDQTLCQIIFVAIFLSCVCLFVFLSHVPHVMREKYCILTDLCWKYIKWCQSWGRTLSKEINDFLKRLDYWAKDFSWRILKSCNFYDNLG